MDEGTHIEKVQISQQLEASSLGEDANSTSTLAVTTVIRSLHTA
jgi:hypothetical protein